MGFEVGKKYVDRAGRIDLGGRTTGSNPHGDLVAALPPRGRGEMSGKLAYKWSKRERDYLISYPSAPDGHLMHSFMGGHMSATRFLTELSQRGYDLTTLRVEVKKKAAP